MFSRCTGMAMPSSFFLGSNIAGKRLNFPDLVDFYTKFG